MGKAKRHEKSHKKNTPYYQPIKLTGQGIKRRQHSQDGNLRKSDQASPTSQAPNKNFRQQSKVKVPFVRSDRVLLVGEGDFSFSLSLARHHEVCAIVATSYDDEAALTEKYPLVEGTLRNLLGERHTASTIDHVSVHTDEEWDGFSPASNNSSPSEVKYTPLKSTNVTILHGIDAVGLSKLHKKTLNLHVPFTKIVFNFPHTGGLSTDVNRQVRANQELLVGFLNAAKPLLATKARPAKPLALEEAENEDEDADEFLEENEHNDHQSSKQRDLSSGQILVTLFEGEPYTLWNIRDLARHCGLQVIESFKFPWAAYPGYKHARTIGDIVTGKDRSDEGKRKGAWRGEERDARCYVLGLREELSDMAGKKKRRRDANDSDGSE